MYLFRIDDTTGFIPFTTKVCSWLEDFNVFLAIIGHGAHVCWLENFTVFAKICVMCFMAWGLYRFCANVAENFTVFAGYMCEDFTVFWA